MQKNSPACGLARGKMLAAALVLVIALFPAAWAAEPKPFTIGVVPQLPPVAMHENWTPFVERLARDTGLAFKLKVYEKMNDFEADISAGQPDFIFANPVQVVMARNSRGYIPLVRSTKRVAGILFVRKDSDIRSVRDLAGQDVAFVGARNL